MCKSCTYKIIAKVANKLTNELPSAISQNHSIFTPVKLITDNILVAYEALHTMDAWMKGRGRYMALKIDTSKMRFFESNDAEDWFCKEVDTTTCDMHQNLCLLGGYQWQTYSKIIPT